MEEEYYLTDGLRSLAEERGITYTEGYRSGTLKINTDNVTFFDMGDDRKVLVEEDYAGTLDVLGMTPEEVMRGMFGSEHGLAEENERLHEAAETAWKISNTLLRVALCHHTTLTHAAAVKIVKMQKALAAELGIEATNGKE